MFRLACISTVVALAALCAAASAQRPSPTPKTPQTRGAQLYVRIGCVQCHGGVGQGGGEGPAVVATRLNYDAFARQVRQPIDKMPPYTRKILSDEDLRAIYDYVLTLRP